MHKRDREKKKKAGDRGGESGRERVGLSFVLSECLLQRSKRLSCCPPTRPLFLLGHAACIKMEGLHFCLPVHDKKTSTSTSLFFFLFWRLQLFFFVACKNCRKYIFAARCDNLTRFQGSCEWSHLGSLTWMMLNCRETSEALRNVSWSCHVTVPSICPLLLTVVCFLCVLWRRLCYMQSYTDPSRNYSSLHKLQILPLHHQD